jgi:hypothetical protein
MPRRTRRRGPGQPTKLTPERANHILDLISSGNHATTACAAAGIGQSAYYSWISKGQDAIDEHERTGQPIPEAKRVYADFAERVARARARAETRAVSTVRRSMEGGFVTSEEPVLGADGDVLRDDNGEILYKRTYAQPDGRLALQYLERARPDEWSRNAASRVELSGPEGGPVQVEQQVVVASLAERLAGVVAARRADAELEAAEPGEDGAYQITGGDDAGEDG